MSTPIEGDKPKYDPSLPDGRGSWREKRYSAEELDVLIKEQDQAKAGQTPAETSELGDDLVIPPWRSFIAFTPTRRRGGAMPGIPLSKVVQRGKETDSGSEQVKPLVVGIGEEFPPYALPQGPYRGAESVKEAISMCPAKATTVTLHSEVLPDLDFQIVTIPSRVEDGKSEIIIESSIRQTLELGLLHKTGRRAAVFPSWQPYGFNEDVLPLIQRLRFSFIDSESQSEAKPEIRSTGQVQFKFTANGDELTPDLRGRFDLAEDPIEEGIKAAAMGDPEEETRLRKAVAENPVLRDFFLHGPTGLTSTAPDFSVLSGLTQKYNPQHSGKHEASLFEREGQEFDPKSVKTVHIREVDGNLIRFVELDGKVYVWNSENKLEGYEGTIPPLKRRNRPFRF